MNKLVFQGFKTIVQLSFRDYLHERLMSICAIMGMAAVMAPLLVLFGLKNGIIDTMTDRLVRDPNNLEISPVGSGRYDASWLDALAQNPKVSFVISRTRAIAAIMVLQHLEKGHYATLAVDLIPTAKGDPLLQKWGAIPETSNEVVLTAQAGRKLGLKPGSRIKGQIGRSVNGKKEQVSIDLTVLNILPLQASQKEAAFVLLPLLEATEDYRDGFGVPAFGFPGPPKPQVERSYPSFRLYTHSIYDIAQIRDQLQNQGIEVYTRAEEIEIIRNLDQSFTLIFGLIFVVAVLGYFAAMASNVLANVNRKSRYLGIIRLIGFSTGSIVWFPIVQSAATGFFGAVTAFVLYFCVELMINRIFGQYLTTGEYICHLTINQLLLALTVTLTLSVCASAYAARRVSMIEPSEVIRDV